MGDISELEEIGTVERTRSLEHLVTLFCSFPLL